MSGDSEPFAGYSNDMDLEASQTGRIIGSCVAIFIITDLFVLLRLISRKKARAGYWWDDVLAVIAMLFSNVLCILWFIELRNGYGRHIYRYPMPERMHKEIRWRRDFFVFELFFHTAITICKFSVLAFYYRIFPYRTFRNVLFVVAGLSLGYGISIDVTIFVQCLPTSYQWELPDPTKSGKCVNFHKFFVGKGIANVVLNVIIFALPIPLLWRLRVTLRQQIILTTIFTLAGFVIIVSIVWIVVVPDVTQRDITWGAVNFGIWSTLEPNIAVICACIPSLHPLVKIIRHNAVFQHPLIQSTKARVKASTLGNSVLSTRKSAHSAAGAGGGKKFRGDSTSGESNAGFERMEEMDDLAMGNRYMGNGVDVRASRGSQMGGGEHTGGAGGGRGGGDVEMGAGVPQGEIAVKTDVVVETSARLPYNDRLF